MSHIIIPAAEEILDKKFKVSNHGFVRLVDYLGGDDRIVQAARVSYGKEIKTKREDEVLIRYLMEQRHTSPFEQVEMVFHVRLPIFVARQWIRHRTASVNEISGRYSRLEDEFFAPQPEDIRKQSTKNHQSRNDQEFEPEAAQRIIKGLIAEQRFNYERYEERLKIGMAREISRVNLPLSIYTEWYWKIDLHNLFHFLKLRMDSHAQKEIRDYAKVMVPMVKRVVPVAYEAWQEYVLCAVTFSKTEMEALRIIMAGDKNPLKESALETFNNKLGPNDK